jgi:hypothetical protein
MVWQSRRQSSSYLLPWVHETCQWSSCCPAWWGCHRCQTKAGSRGNFVPPPYASVRSPSKEGMVTKLFLSTVKSPGKKGVCHLEIQSWSAVLKLLNDWIDTMRKPFF